jgi:nitroimidazol reductase NimA-like FMN-containing flavoprotein (pyridoxamine 5'-phosphate oxidase superfamily)
MEECLARLAVTPLGRLAFVSAGESVILPVNHGVDGSCVVFRTTEGSKMDVAVECGNVAFEVDGYDADAETGWSVVVKGTAELVYDDAETARFEALGLRSWADPQRQGQWVRIRPEEISGREVVAR